MPLTGSMIAAYGPYAASATGGNGLARDFLAGIAAMYATPCTSLFSSPSENILICSLREHRRSRLRPPPRMANYHPRYLGCYLHHPDLRLLLQGTVVPRPIEVCPESRWREEISACARGETASGRRVMIGNGIGCVMPLPNVI
jgi:hypothetical protein